MIREFGLSEALAILSGVQSTILLSLIAFAGGGVVGLAIALMRTSERAWLRRCAGFYIDFFQGTPLLMQLFLVFYGLPVLGYKVNPWVAVTIGFTLHASAFLGEVWRGSIQAVPRGQSEAAYALGLSYVSRMRNVVLPQAMRISVAPTVGFMVQLIKGTSLAAIIGFVELSRAAQIIASATYKPLLAYGCAAIVYFLLCFPLSRLSMRLEKRFAVKS
ncbi:amino acid ABC transporter permease [Bosea sp. Root670]|jgi:polar amino acid transport system permease protein|uniref:Polar amino acid transport system permease protein n=1 Tax=Bosea robiniae TaxID=1036780 RepID=A0ABY0P3L4_9HYPH|nr:MULTISPECIES: amino acid ABC transporter permease [Bosea]KRE00838.1 amino acid ABC transporter permease [Bosea sp. Root670]TQI74015.1 amino acid ABC transporter membrane protein 2 (PAAT family) [Bosea sp. AK1]SDH14473.1 polar amino acid transport system permease protein [Bosea robiniae]